MLHILWITPLALLIVYLSSPRFRGDIAETRVRRLLAAGLDKNRYTLLNDLILPSGGGTIHIDHLVVSKFGVFVIESEHVSGWVSGGEFQERWKQQRFGRHKRFDNPVHCNVLQTQALQTLLKLPSSAFCSLVVLEGHRGFKSEMPANLVPVDKLIACIRKRSQHLLEAEQVAEITKTIRETHIEPAGRFYLSPWGLLRLLLILVLAAGIYLVFSEQISSLVEQYRVQSQQASSPEKYHPDGSPKSERELWEDRLRCAYSPDTGRCACYEEDGTKAELGLSTCRSIAERGSILQR